MFKNLKRALTLACLFSPLVPHAQAPQAQPLPVAFVYVTPIGQAGWTYQHELGRQALEKALGPKVKTTMVESVAEGPDAERVMRDLAAQGHRLIFATSFGYLEPALRVGAETPAARIEVAGGFKTAANVGGYNGRFYEGRYLAGVLAARASKSGVAGYVAGFPVPEVVQGINAFALGMRSVNPKAIVKVVWLNTWFDPAREREAAIALVDGGADVLANHSGSPAVPQAAQEKGVRMVAYQSDMRRFAPKAQLAAVTADWSGHYVRQTQAVLSGTWRPQLAWGGLKDGMVALSAIDPALPKAARDEVEAKRRAIVEGRLAPFGGRLVDNTGRVRQEKGTLADAQIASMDWFVEGVVGSVPGR
jgi:simple sugar transport system substrate-binding protein